MMKNILLALAGSCFLLIAAPTMAQLNIPSDGTDGAFNPANNDPIDLRLAATGKWDDPSPVAGRGIYDPDKWAVVFKYSSVNIASGRTVSFTNHPSGAPVVWLVQGNVTVNGAINLNGAGGSSSVVLPNPGPGGFRGGRGTNSGLGSGGYGPGGGGYPISTGRFGAGSYSTTGTSSLGSQGVSGRVYGNVNIIPLIGGSGGQGGTTDVWSGGSGAGAILIACSENFTLGGSITANGGPGVWTSGGSTQSGSGSGGAIRLIGNYFSGSGTLEARGGVDVVGNTIGGLGRLRVETGTTVDLTANMSIDPSYAQVGPNPQIWPDSSTPAVRIKTIGGFSVDQDPRPNTLFPADVTLPTTATVAVVAETNNVPTSGQVLLRLVPRFGVTQSVTATFDSGNITTGTWTANIEFPQGFSTIQGQAILP